MTSKYSIKDIERLSGIKAHTIRIWEQRYNIIEPKRTETNIRFYDDEDLKRLLNVSYLVLDGVKISKVAQLTEEQLHSMVQERAHYTGNHTAEINALKMAMFAYDEDAFTHAFTQSVQRYGEHETFTQVLGGFISELGVLWQTNTVNVTHEHFVSNLIKQKLFSAIDQCSVKPDPAKPSFLLYLPATELHEIGLLHISYVLKKRGCRIISMGQNTPCAYLPQVYDKTPFDYAISVFTTAPHFSEVEQYIEELKKEMSGRNVKFLFCGAQLGELIARGFTSEEVSIFKNVTELQNHLPV